MRANTRRNLPQLDLLVVFSSEGMFSDCARSSRICEGRQERAAIRTWTLDALGCRDGAGESGGNAGHC